LDEIRSGQYVGAEEIEDEDKMNRMTSTLKTQCTEAARLDMAIWANLKE
jgi:hypothetical protein